MATQWKVWQGDCFNLLVPFLVIFASCSHRTRETTNDRIDYDLVLFVSGNDVPDAKLKAGAWQEGSMEFRRTLNIGISVTGGGGKKESLRVPKQYGRGLKLFAVHRGLTAPMRLVTSGEEVGYGVLEAADSAKIDVPLLEALSNQNGYSWISLGEGDAPPSPAFDREGNLVDEVVFWVEIDIDGVRNRSPPDIASLKNLHKDLKLNN